ncbi:hypothetical protein ACFL6E_01450 [Candidatus Neomarinimicrobiota bacterium]
MLKIPTSSIARTPFLFSAGFSSELYSFAPFNSTSGIYFDSEISKNFRFGFSSVQVADTTGDLENSILNPPLEIGFHIQQRLWTYGNISFSLGLQDIVLTREEGTFSIDPTALSYFGVIASEQSIGAYNLSTYMGFGTGAIAGATAITDTVSSSPSTESSSTADSSLNLGVYAGFRMKTPVFAKRGGLDLIGEYDGNGVNVGVSIPITVDYRMQIGLTHVENLPGFGSQVEKLTLESDAPSIVIALNLSVPRIVPATVGSEVSGMGSRVSPDELRGSIVPAQLDSTLEEVEYILAELRDSLRIADFEIDNLQSQLALRDQRSIILADSLRSVQLKFEMGKSNLNYTMRHLSSSLRHFYDENYRDALQEVEMAIQLSPDLALAYARRGSIYYKLGDVQRATINWNLALKLDSEYDDVRNILRALKENRLKTTSLIQQ